LKRKRDMTKDWHAGTLPPPMTARSILCCVLLLFHSPEMPRTTEAARILRAPVRDPTS
jgi:hypothetical protein